jgi:hypothetical protein
MSAESTEQEERPCLHCLFADVIDQFYDEYPAGEDGAVDPAEVIDAAAKTIAELTAGQTKEVRQEMIEQLMNQIMVYDGEFRKEDAAGVRSDARH